MKHVKLYAAGSLTQAFGKVAGLFEEKTGIPVYTEFGSSARIAKMICEGDSCDVFASADMDMPQKLVNEGYADHVIPFVNNEMVAVVRNADMTKATDNLMGFLHHPSTRIGISCPETQPCGMNALTVLAKAGTGGSFNKKLDVVTGGWGKKIKKEFEKRSDYAVAIEDGRVDALIVFRTTGIKLAAQSPAIKMIELPEEINVTAQYGMVLLEPRTPNAENLSRFILSRHAGDIFREYGFKIHENMLQDAFAAEHVLKITDQAPLP
ncbi:MAG: molybdate ABC transporter substrate-binding protein [Micavibrio sp.]